MPQQEARVDALITAAQASPPLPRSAPTPSPRLPTST